MIQFELVSPEERLFSEPVATAVIPGEEGYFGVKKDHCSLVASLKPGVVDLYANDDEQPTSIFVAGGFADVSGENCIILAEEALLVKDIDVKALQKRLGELEEDLSLAEEESDKRRIKGAIDLIHEKISAAQRNAA